MIKFIWIDVFSKKLMIISTVAWIQGTWKKKQFQNSQGHEI